MPSENCQCGDYCSNACKKGWSWRRMATHDAYDLYVKDVGAMTTIKKFKLWLQKEKIVIPTEGTEGL